jgi:hypothetical protein
MLMGAGALCGPAPLVAAPGLGALALGALADAASCIAPPAPPALVVCPDDEADVAFTLNGGRESQPRTPMTSAAPTSQARRTRR